jgi:alginate O-acetyltransferase complex protein AlgJ
MMASSDKHPAKIFSPEKFHLFLFGLVICLPLVGYVFTGLRGPFVENFFGYRQLIYLGNNFKFRVLQDTYFRDLIAHQNGWLAYTGEDSLNDFQNINSFTKPELTRIKNRYDRLCEYATRKKIRMIFVIPPNKNTIYPEYIPDEIPQQNKLSRLDQILLTLDHKDNCNVIDLRKVLLEGKKTGQVYFSTDSHWNDLGAFLGYQVITDELHQSFPAIQTHTLSEYKKIPFTYHGDLTKDTFGQIDVQEVAGQLELINPPQVIERQQRYFDGAGLPSVDVIVTQNSRNDLPTAVVYRDSFFYYMVPYLKNDFSKATFIWDSQVDPFILDTIDPDILIFEMTERSLKLGLFLLPEDEKYPQE